jgi:hypothetical protein
VITFSISSPDINRASDAYILFLFKLYSYNIDQCKSDSKLTVKPKRNHRYGRSHLTQSGPVKILPLIKLFAAEKLRGILGEEREMQNPFVVPQSPSAQTSGAIGVVGFPIEIDHPLRVIK